MKSVLLGWCAKIYAHDCLAESGDQWWVALIRTTRPIMGSIVAACRIVNSAVLDIVDPTKLIGLRDVDGSNLQVVWL